METDRPWLTYERAEDDDLVLFCAWCKRHDKARGGYKSSAWIESGCTQLMLQAITDRKGSIMHRESAAADQAKSRMQSSGGLSDMTHHQNRKRNEKYDTGMIKAMEALYWIAKEKIALRKWHSLKDLQHVGVDLSPPLVAGNAKYDSDAILAELLAALASVVDNETDRLITESSFYGVLMDETTDVSNLGQLDLHLRLVKDGVISSRFGNLISLSERTADVLIARVKDWCAERSIPVRRSNAGSDGCSTFAGRQHGVVAQLWRDNPQMIGIHCVCHREALAAENACNAVKYLEETMQPVLASVYRHFSNSSVHEAGLHSMEILNEQGLKLVEPKFV